MMFAPLCSEVLFTTIGDKYISNTTWDLNETLPHGEAMRRAYGILRHACDKVQDKPDKRVGG